MRQHPLFDANEEHVRELQPFGRVEGNEGDRVAVVAVLVELVDVLDQRHIFEERRQRVFRCQLIVVLGFVAQLLDVGPAFLAFLGRVPLEELFVAAALEDQVDDVQHRAVGQLLADRLDDVGEATKHLPRPDRKWRPGSQRVGAPVEPQCSDAHERVVRRDLLLG